MGEEGAPEIYRHDERKRKASSLIYHRGKWIGDIGTVKLVSKGAGGPLGAARYLGQRRTDREGDDKRKEKD